MVGVKNALQVTFGNTLRTLRVGRGLSQEKLAEKSELHANYIGGIERGERNPGLLTIVKLSRALKCSVGELFVDTE